MHVLVTGGAGFIGSYIVDSLLADGHDVTVLDNFDGFYGRSLKEQNIREHRKHTRWRVVEADLRDFDELETKLSPPTDVIVHLAARAGVRPSIEHPLTYQEVNVGGTQNLLELARRREIRQFVFASSSSVYGVNPRVLWSEKDHVLKPISPYASTKESGELIGHVYSHLYRNPVHCPKVFHGLWSKAAARSGHSQVRQLDEKRESVACVWRRRHLT